MQPQWPLFYRRFSLPYVTRMKETNRRHESDHSAIYALGDGYDYTALRCCGGMDAHECEEIQFPTCQILKGLVRFNQNFVRRRVSQLHPVAVAVEVLGGYNVIIHAHTLHIAC